MDIDGVPHLYIEIQMSHAASTGVAPQAIYRCVTSCHHGHRCEMLFLLHVRVRFAMSNLQVINFLSLRVICVESST